MLYANPNTDGSLVQFRSRYDNYIGGEFVPADGKYFKNLSPVNGKIFCEVTLSSAKDIKPRFADDACLLLARRLPAS